MYSLLQVDWTRGLAEPEESIVELETPAADPEDTIVELSIPAADPKDQTVG